MSSNARPESREEPPPPPPDDSASAPDRGEGEPEGGVGEGGEAVTEQHGAEAAAEGGAAYNEEPEDLAAAQDPKSARADVEAAEEEGAGAVRVEPAPDGQLEPPAEAAAGELLEEEAPAVEPRVVEADGRRRRKKRAREKK